MCQLFSLVFFCFFLKKKKGMSREGKARRNLIFIFDNEHLENKSTPYLLLLLATEVLFKVERERELCFSFSLFLSSPLVSAS